LRADVLARRSCLDALPRAERRVLVLRAGVGAAAPRSRGTVARRLDVTVRRVRYLERSGLRRLRTLCGAATMEPTVLAADGSPPATAIVLPPTRRAGGGRESKPSRTATPTPSREAERPSSGRVAGQSVTHLPSPADGGLSLAIPLLLLALGTAGFIVGRTLRRDATVLTPGPPIAPSGSIPAATSWSAPAAASWSAPAATSASTPTTASASGDWTTPPAGGVGDPAAPAAKPPPPPEDAPRDPAPSHRPAHRR
jgi:hypothetical protein